MSPRRSSRSTRRSTPRPSRASRRRSPSTRSTSRRSTTRASSTRRSESPPRPCPSSRRRARNPPRIRRSRSSSASRTSPSSNTTAPRTPLVGPAERLRDTIIAARAAERRFSAEVRLGATYDDNVDVRPNSDTREPLVSELRRPRHESFGELFGARAEYVWWKTDEWQSTLGYSFFTTYNNDIPKFNVIDHLGSLGVSRKGLLGDHPAVLGAQYSWDTLALDGKEFLTRHTGTASLVVLESEMHLTQVFVRYQNKDFAATTEPRPVPQEERDANNYLAGFLHFMRFAQDKHFLKAGWQLDYDDTGGANYEYLGHRFSVGGQYTLPWAAVRLKYDLDAHLRAYGNKNSLFPSYAPGTRRRRDEEITNVLRAEVPLPASLTLAGEYQSTMGRSNLEIFDYTRNVFSLVLSWSY